MERSEIREWLFEHWQALRAACRERHAAEMKGRAGGAAVCICGCGCGGCKACKMLSEIRDFIAYADAGRMRAHDRAWIEMMRTIA